MDLFGKTVLVEKQSLWARIKSAIVYAVLAEVPPCGSYKIWTDCGYEFDCKYGGEVECEHCVCVGGNIDPRTDRKFKKFRRYFS